MTLIMITLLITIIISSVTSTRVEVARCRAHCLSSLSKDCLQGSETCTSCWSACEDPCQCHEEDRGCQAACDWSDAANRVTNRRQGDRVQVWELATDLSLDRDSCMMTWGKVRASSNSFRSSTRPVAPRSPPVYVLVAEDETGELWELGQTNTRQQELVGNMFPDTVTIRLVVVGAEGVRLTSSLDTRHLDCVNHQFLPVVTQSQIMEDDLLKVSVTWDNNDVEESPEYVVRWREYSLEERRDLRSVMGTMMVQGNKAQVTLRPDTGYILQVENKRTGEMSQSVIIDTTRAEEDLDSVAVILLIITMVLATLVMVALIIVFIYKRQDKKTEAVKQNLNNNDTLDSSSVPLNLDYNNLC